MIGIPGAHRGWSVVRSLSEEKKRELTVVAKVHNKIVDVPMYHEYPFPSGSLFLIPRTTRHPEAMFVEPLTYGSAISSDAAIKVRPYQDEAVRVTVSWLKNNLGGVLEAPCGSGKTVMGLEVCRRLGRKTLVLVHKSFLMDQWQERIRQFLPDVTVGIWRGEKCELDADIVIGMIQSVHRGGHTVDGVFQEYPQAAYTDFGLIITDECHFASAPTWVLAITRFSAAYRLGLSATPTRRDGLEEVFYKHIGPIHHTVSVAVPYTRVAVVNLGTEVDPRRYTFKWKPSEINSSGLITILADDDARTREIVSHVEKAVLSDRRPFVFTHRRAHVKKIAAMLRARFSGIEAPPVVAEFLGGMSLKQQATVKDADVIVGTYSMADTGLDMPGFDTMFLATPKVDIQQAIGRLARDGGKPSLVIDFVDRKIPPMVGYSKAREKIYTRLKCTFSNRA